jgi:hypothetical protein
MQLGLKIQSDSAPPPLKLQQTHLQRNPRARLPDCVIQTSKFPAAVSSQLTQSKAVSRSALREVKVTNTRLPPHSKEIRDSSDPQSAIPDSPPKFAITYRNPKRCRAPHCVTYE